MLTKINLYACLAGCLLFFLPWLSVRSPLAMEGFSQNGIAICIGAVQSSQTGLGGVPSDAKPSALAIAAMVFTVIAVMGAFSDFRNNRPSLRTGIAAGVALLCIAIQFYSGFPVLKKIAIDSHLEGIEPVVLAAILERGLGAGLVVSYSVFFYLELLALAIPALTVLNGWLDTLRRNR